MFISVEITGVISESDKFFFDAVDLISKMIEEDQWKLFIV